MIKCYFCSENNVSFFCFIFIGVFQSNILFANFTGFPEKSLALDNNLQTFHQPDKQTEQLWFLRLKLIYKIKWILVSIRGGIVYFIYLIRDLKK